VPTELLTSDDLDELGHAAFDADDRLSVAVRLVAAVDEGRLADPADASYALSLAAEITDHAGDLEGAVVLAGRAAEASRSRGPGYGHPRALYGRLLLRAGREDEGLAVLGMLRPLLLRDEDAVYYVSDALQEGGHARTAVAWLTPALETALERRSAVASRRGERVYEQAAVMAYALAQQRYRLRRELDLPVDEHDLLAERLRDAVDEILEPGEEFEGTAVLFWPRAEFETLVLRCPGLADVYGAGWDEHRTRLQRGLVSLSESGEARLAVLEGSVDGWRTMPAGTAATRPTRMCGRGMSSIWSRLTRGFLGRRNATRTAGAGLGRSTRNAACPGHEPEPPVSRKGNQRACNGVSRPPHEQFNRQLSMSIVELSELLPYLSGVRIEAVVGEDAWALVRAAAQGDQVACPGCGVAARRVHSNYQRRLRDTAIGGRATTIELTVRRFFCDNAGCTRKTFVEQVAGLTTRYARHSLPARVLALAVAFALGGRAGARLLHVLAMPFGRMSLLRAIRATPEPDRQTPRVLGIDLSRPRDYPDWPQAGALEWLRWAGSLAPTAVAPTNASMNSRFTRRRSWIFCAARRARGSSCAHRHPVCRHRRADHLGHRPRTQPQPLAVHRARHGQLLQRVARAPPLASPLGHLRYCSRHRGRHHSRCAGIIVQQHPWHPHHPRPVRPGRRVSGEPVQRLPRQVSPLYP
jgi:zinc-finger of transposase IS204/IS1001/IS1096/IS1165